MYDVCCLLVSTFAIDKNNLGFINLFHRYIIIRKCVENILNFLLEFDVIGSNKYIKYIIYGMHIISSA